MPRARITVTLPDEVVRAIDKRERNRSRFVLQAVEHELESRRRQELLESLENHHPRSEEVAEAGVAEWGRWGAENDSDLVDTEAGRAVSWSPRQGWIEEDG